MQSQTRKNCLHSYISIDHTVANELLRRVSTLLKGLIGQKKKQNYESLQKVRKAQPWKKFFYKRISNYMYIKTCSATPNTDKFARVKGWAKKHKCSIACDHTTGRLIKTRSNKITCACKKKFFSWLCLPDFLETFIVFFFCPMRPLSKVETRRNSSFATV